MRRTRARTRRRFDKSCTTKFNVSGRGKLGQDQESLIVVHEVAITVTNKECGTPTSLRRHIWTHPEPIPGSRVKTTYFTMRFARDWKSKKDARFVKYTEIQKEMVDSGFDIDSIKEPFRSKIVDVLDF